jgi:hemerythrin-like metal-binding protein
MMNEQNEAQEKEMPPLPGWRSNPGIGKRKLDEQHRKMLETCRRVVELCAGESTSTTQLSEACNDYAELLIRHLQAEEQTLARNGSTRLEQHKAERSTLCESVVELLYQATQGPLDREAWMRAAQGYRSYADAACL